MKVVSPVKAKNSIGRIFGFSAWHRIDPSQIEAGQSRSSKKTVWCRLLDVNEGQRIFRARCIHTGAIRYGLFEEIHTVMPEGYSHV